MDAINTTALAQLNGYRSKLTPQQFKTLRGQILAGNCEGAMRGLQKILERRPKRRDHQTRQGPGNSHRQQPKD
jgi:hypothetical protein